MAEGKGVAGWRFPVQVDPRTGAIAMTDNEAADIRQSILILLNTMRGERFLHPAYGCQLRQFMFEPISYSLVKNIRDEVQRSIRRWEPRVDAVSTEVFHSEKEETKLIIQINYRIKASGNQDTLHYLYSLLEEPL